MCSSVLFLKTTFSSAVKAMLGLEPKKSSVVNKTIFLVSKTALNWIYLN